MRQSFFRTFLRRGAVSAAALWLTGCEAPSVRSAPGGESAATSTPGALPMDLEKNKALARRIIEEGFNQRRPEALRAWIAPEFRSHNPSVAPGPNGVESFVRRFIDGFADFSGQIREVVAEADKVAVWVEWRGTHTGPFAGVAATGRRVEFASVEFFRFTEGRWSEHWDVVDRLALQTALGLVTTAR
jgi:predicted ester cyclase